MPSPDKAGRVAIYGALAIGLWTVENYLPTPLPWLRLGLANMAVVLALDELGVGAGVAVLLLKLVVGSMLAGRFLTPFFFFGAAGGGLALLAMAFLKLAGRRYITVVGLSCAGGVCHNIGQLVVARFLLVSSPVLLRLLPLLSLLGVITGTLVGLLARLVQLRTKTSLD